MVEAQTGAGSRRSKPTGNATRVRSFCRMCAACCGIVATIEDGQVVSVSGDRDHPLSRGYTCEKGRGAVAVHYRADRLDYPQIRVNDTLKRASWGAALDDLADRLSRLLDDGDPDAIGAYLGTFRAYETTARYIPDRFLQAIGSKSRYTALTVDCPNKSLVPKLMAGTMLMPVPDYRNATLMIYLGSNPLVSHGHGSKLPNPVGYLREVTKRGAVWVIDTRSTETAKLATRHLLPRPCTDYALLAHLIRELLADGADTDYLARFTTGQAELEQAVQPFDADRTAELTGVPTSQLSELLAAIRQYGTVVVETGTGLTMGPAANVTEWLRWALMIITGSIERPGGWWFHPGWLTPMPEGPAREYNVMPSPGPRSRPDILRWLDEYPCAVMADEIEAGFLRAMFVLGGNPVAAFPDEYRTRRTLAQLEVLAVADILPTATTELATHVFPALDSLERSDLISAERAQMALITQYTPAITTPSAERRAIWWIFAQLADRMGVAGVTPPGTPANATDEDIMASIAATAFPSFDDVRERRGPWLLDAAVFGWVHEAVLPPGGWRLAPHQLTRQLEGLPVPAPLVLQNRRQRKQTNSLMVTAADVVDHAVIHMNTKDARSAGITHGARVVVRSRTGETTGIARVDEAIAPGAVSIPHGFTEPSVQRLTVGGPAIDPMTGMPLYVGVPVTVEPVQELSKGTGPAFPDVDVR